MKKNCAVFCFLAVLLLLSLQLPAGEEPERKLGADDIPAHIAEAEVGEWALYRLSDGKRSRLTVVEKWEEDGETHIIIRNDILNAKGKRLRSSEEKVIVGEAVENLRTLGPEDRVVDRDILFQGRKLDVIVVETVDNGVVTLQSYLSDEIPVYGLVKGVNPKAKVKTVINLLDYGFADEEPD